jgi:serine protease inhibitor
MIDHTDCLQNEYIGLQSLEKIFEEEDNEEEENIIIMPYKEETKSLFMNKPTTNTLLDTFVKIKKEEKTIPMNNIPQQKEINLSDPKFMVKGIIYN